MTRKPRLTPALAGVLALATSWPAAAAERVPDAALWPAATGQSAHDLQREYRIGPLDLLNITVFQVKDLTLDKVQVDASGQILLPLVGSLVASGKTTSELSALIADKLRERYMQDPQVSVLVEEAVSQKVTVEGNVTEAGVFFLKGQTSLLQAIALAKGIARNGNSHKVTIFREVDGRRVSANFDLTAIMGGKQPDPQIFGGDVVVVPSSSWKGFVRDAIPALPALVLFR